MHIMQDHIFCQIGSIIRTLKCHIDLATQGIAKPKDFLPLTVYFILIDDGDGVVNYLKGIKSHFPSNKKSLGSPSSAIPPDPSIGLTEKFRP